MTLDLRIRGISTSMRPFFKYASPDTTIAILLNRSYRYSTPKTFNDPFDVQSGLHFDFDTNTLHGKIIDRIEKLASAPADPNVDPNDVWGKVVLEARKYYPTHGFPKDRWLTMTSEHFVSLLQEIKDTQKKYQEHWWETLLPSIRVFCVSEERDNLLMWAHYARDHTGAVLELWSLPEEDNPLSVARPVNYVCKPPPFFTESEWLDDFTGIKKLDFSALYKRYAYAKSQHWEYEREWRIWYPLADAGDHDYVPMKGREFKALYIGCRAKPEFARQATVLAKSLDENIKVYQARKKESLYGLEYTEV